MEKRKPNIELNGYPSLINQKILEAVANRVHPMAEMPYYDKKNEPTKLHEEVIIENRYKMLFDAYRNTFDSDTINETFIMLNNGMNCLLINALEKEKRQELIKLVEKIIRLEWNVGQDEILFDLEIVDIGDCSLPNEINIEKKIPETYQQTKDFDILKKRTINALTQGSALTSHYIFHMYKDDFNNLCPDITDIYQKFLISNDLYYFILDDDMLMQMLSVGVTDSNAGYCRINFDGDIPVIEAKAINAPILLHEVTKALVTFLSIPGIQDLGQDVVDETDYVLAELWDIRFGFTLWTTLHSLINEYDYDIKKLILIELFKMDSEKFVKEFMYNVLNDEKQAKKEIEYIVKKIRNSILEYEFEQNFDDIDLSDFGF